MGTKAKKGSRSHDDFYAGMLAALEIVALHGEEAIFREIVETANEAELVEYAQRDGMMDCSGLARYGYGRNL